MTDFEIIESPNIGPDATCLNLAQSNTKNEVMVTIKPPQEGNRFKTRVICLLDKSQSMITPISYTTQDGKTEDDGLTRMDLAIHTYKTLVNSMPEDVEFGLVTFNGSANQVLPLTKMTSENKTSAIALVDNLIPTGMTNLWKPLEMALKTFLTNPNTDIDIDDIEIEGEDNTSGGYDTNDIVIMLTDGEPTSSPIRGELTELESYLKNFAPHNTPYFVPIGFTNGQDSTLLNNMARLTSEISYFISDASMMGTVFINTLSYLMSTALTNMELLIETNESTEINSTIRHIYKCSHYEPHKVVLQLGSTGYGLNRNIIIPVKSLDDSELYLNATLTYNSPKSSNSSYTIQNDGFTSVSDNYFRDNMARINFVSYLRDAIKTAYEPSTSKETLITGLNQIREMVQPDDTFLKGIETDYYEAVKATDPNYINTWGTHYLIGLANSHNMERCTNFKDAGLQNYVSLYFDTLRKAGEKIFNDIDIVKHSFLEKPLYTSPGYTNSQYRTPSFRKAKHTTLYGCQTNYLDASNGCFAPSTLVTMGTGLTKQAKNIKKGDVIRSMDKVATVKCVVRFRCDKGKADMCDVDGLIVSPYHPIYYNDRWQFPASLAETFKYDTEYVYDFVLEDNSAVYVNGIMAATMGHGLKTDVVRHAYFGTNCITKDLAKLKGWDNGLITLPPNCFKRTEVNMPISGLMWNKLKGMMA